MSKTHRITGHAFDSLAAGLGDATVIKALRAAQVSRRKLQLRLLLESIASAEFADAYTLLAEAATRSPAVEEAVLSEPHFGAWLATTLREVRRGGVEARPDIGYLQGLAASAAARAGMGFSIDIIAHRGGVVLPMTGRWPVREPKVTVAGTAGSVDIRDAHAEFQPLRTLSSRCDGLEIVARLDDVDPYRHNHVHPAADRLTPQQINEWQALLDSAWTILVRHHHPYAVAIAEGLHTVVPLRTTHRAQGVNVTNKDAFGAVAMTTPATGEAFAVGLLHEFQHAKLYALLDIVELHSKDDRPRYYAPWRDDPRPLGAALQGVYAFLGVTDFWRVQRHVAGNQNAGHAEAEFARWRDRIRLTTEALVTTGDFTPSGKRFMDGLWHRQDSWRAEPVSARAAALAAEASEDHWIGWRLRNQRPDDEVVRELAERWTSGQPCLPVRVHLNLVDPQGSWLSSSARLDLARLRLNDPTRLAALVAEPERLAREHPQALAGDLALAQGEHATAMDRYLAEITGGTGDVGAWIGLTLASRRGGLSPKALADFPELCYAIFKRMHETDGVPPDPVALAYWLSPVSGGDVTS